MNPPPQPQPHQPQVVVVQQKSGCGKAALIGGVIAAVLCLIVGGCVILGIGAAAKGIKAGVDHAEAARKEKESKVAALEIVDFAWTKDGFGSVMEANFKIHNGGTVDMKDIEIECTHFANSGTRIDSNRRTIYEIVKAGETREFKAFNMGFIHSQATKSVPKIVGAAELKPDTTPAP